MAGEVYSTLQILTNALLKFADLSYLCTEVIKCSVRAPAGKCTLQAGVTEAGGKHSIRLVT